MLIVLNHKCNLTKTQYISYLKELEQLESTHNLVLCPSPCYLSVPIPQNIVLGSQNCSSFEQGAHTGEISATQLKSLDIEYCLVGHSERRQEEHETKECLKEKLIRLLNTNITPILCVGETEKERNDNKTLTIIKENIDFFFQNLTEEDKNKIIISYEPIWAIGTNNTPTKEDLMKIFDYINSLCPNNKIFYGGGVTEKNISMLKSINTLDGCLLGSISLDTKRLKQLLTNI